MMKFIKKPNLPEGDVALVAAGEMPLFLQNFLAEQHITALLCRNNKLIDSAVKSHADMAVTYIGNGIVVVDKNQRELIAELKNYGVCIIPTNETIQGEYPDDVKLNVALFGDNAIGAFRFSDKALLENIESFIKFETKQGYAKCSVLPVNDNSIITDDESVYNSTKNTLDALLVSKGDVVLPRYEYGFIGGASAKISKDRVLFFGDLEMHRDCDKIVSFLEKHNNKPIYFKGYPLYDIGGLVLLCEK